MRKRHVCPWQSLLTQCVWCLVCVSRCVRVCMSVCVGVHVCLCVGCCRQGLCKRLFYFQHFDSFLTPTAWNIRTLICDTRANIAQCTDACNNKLLTIFTQHAISGCPFSFNKCPTSIWFYCLSFARSDHCQL